MTEPIGNTLTREKVLAMEPGRELDLLVDNHVMNRFEATGEHGTWVYPAPRSKKIAAAWEVLEKMQRAHVHINVNWMDDQYCAEVIEMDPEEGYKYLGQCYDVKTAPEAISKAALLAVMDL